MPLKKNLVAIYLCFFSTYLKGNDTIMISQNQFFIDFENGFILTNIDAAFVNSTWTETKTHIQLAEVCTFINPVSMIKIGVEYTLFIPSKNSNISLYFTELPIIEIRSKDTIVDEKFVLANFSMVEANTDLIKSHIGIQYRGGWSQSLPKKSFEIEFWSDSTGVETTDFSLLGMAFDDDWNLQAMYNEPLRIRSKTNNDLWRMLNTLHYQNQEPEALNGVKMEYVELFINNEYQGVYCLGEKINRKQLKLKKYNGSIRGELYKGVSWGASTFTELPPFQNELPVWSGFEFKHPEEKRDWGNIYDLVDFVINSSDNDFYLFYKNHFEFDNLVDYLIFLNLLRATDNTGKNVYVAKYNMNSKYFFVPWDLDGSFGTIWNGTNENITSDILTNGLYKRLIYDCSDNGFAEKLKNRWNELRNSIINHNYIMTLFKSNFDFLESNGIFKRESLVWNVPFNNQADLNYMTTWLDHRLIYLDMKFNEKCTTMPDTLNDIKIHPNPTDDLIFIATDFWHGLKVSIFNNLGQLVLQESLQQKNNEISLKNLSHGFYLIRVENEGHFEKQELILKN